LPDLTFDEALEVTKIYSIAGLLSKDLSIITKRPFRSPHHTASAASLAGGGKSPHPGEISLAHNGVLFLDELPEFQKNALEVMRQPLEDREVTVSRVNGSYTYPANFMFIASMNPCPCGYYGSEQSNCKCTPKQIHNYINKISGPLLDRIDLHIEVPAVKYSELGSNRTSENSLSIRERVNNARKIQLARYHSLRIHSNSELTSSMIEKFCPLNNDCRFLLKAAFEKLNMSARAYSRILKVARTIADLADQSNIEQEHIAEAIQYRNLDRRYFNNTN
jgi:magnesium chelatase family protein